MRGPRRRRVYDALNTGAQRVLGETIKAGPARGMKFRGGDTAGYVLGLSEPAVQEAMVAHLRPGDVYVDVGTHAGFLALLGSRLVGGGGQVHCFEPVSGNVRMLERNVALNAATNIRVHRLALGDRDAMARMDVSSYITASLAAGSRGEEVRVARLDSLSGLPTIRLMKIDVEGAESEVLDGARRTLRA